MKPPAPINLGSRVVDLIIMLVAAIAVIVVAILALAVIDARSNAARAHDSWISKGGYRGPANGEWCCGAEDCFEIPASNIKPVDGGFLIIDRKEFVPQGEVMPSEDAKYWRCQRPNGTRRCFFAPVTGF